MVQIENYKPFETDIFFYCEEGTATKYTDVENKEALVLSAEVKKGDYVALDTTADKTVKVAGAGDTIIGQVIDNPAFRKDRPTQTSQSGDYNKRICTVRLFGYYAHSVQLKAENAAVAVGDAVAYQGNNTFDKANSGNTIALQSAKAGDASKILVLMGLLGF